MNTPSLQQRAVVEHTEGPLLVIAGPGSGKTFTLVERIVHLVTEKNISPESIFIGTFTEKAAAELITRITRRLLAKNIAVNVNEMYIGTLHSICLRILEESREYTRLKKNFTLLDQFDQCYFIFQRLSEFEELASLSLLLGRDNISRWQRANALCAWLNKLSEEVIDPNSLQQDSDEAVAALGKWYAHYLALLEQENLLDFSVIQLEALKLLENRPAVLAELQEKIRYFMVDEYQDTNTVQERLLFTLAGERKNICVVGDDDQGLYRFRGATIRNILEFPARFAPGECTVRSLTVNYRSDPGIIDFYNRWMGGSVDGFSWRGGGATFRYAKSIVPKEGRAALPQAVIKLPGSPEERNWHSEVLAFLQALRAHGLQNWNQVAFLFRSVRNDKAKALAAYLEENGIPVYAPRADMYFEREEVRLIIGAFLFIFPMFREIRAQWESRYGALDVWDYYDLCFARFAEAMRLPENAEMKNWCVRRVREVQQMLTRKKPLDWGFSKLFYQLLQFPLFAGFVEVGPGKQDERPARNLAIFSQLLVKFEYLHHILVLHPDFLQKNVSDLFNHFLRYIVDGGIGEFEDAEEGTPDDCLAFMTIHQSKGLEFPVTVVGSLEAVPRKQYTELDELLQASYYQRPPFEPLERVKEFDFKRLYYTAYSRAKNLLVLTVQEERSKGKQALKTPSTYFRAFYEPLPDWRALDLNTLAIDKVQQSDLKRQYSYTSHVLVYEGCPRQYQFFKHWEFSPVREGPMLFGTLVHQTIEDMHKTALNGQAAEITEDNVRRWFDVNYANLSHKERVYLAPHSRENAFAHVMRYVDRKGGNWGDIKATEVDVSLVKDEYILTGKIDLIKGRGDTVEIVDFKATLKPNQYAERYLLERYKRQLEIYAHLIRERYGLEVSAMNLYYTGEEDGVPTYSFPYKPASVESTINGVDTVVGCMERREFAVKERTPKLCKECELKPYCDREGTQ